MKTTIKAHSFTEMKALNKAAGQYWFDKDAMSFFSTNLVGVPHKNLFITSEQMDYMGPVNYSVRIFVPETAKILTVGPFNTLTYAQAQHLKDRVLAAMGQFQNREWHIMQYLDHIGGNLEDGRLAFQSGDRYFEIDTRTEANPERLIVG